MGSTDRRVLLLAALLLGGCKETRIIRVAAADADAGPGDIEVAPPDEDDEELPPLDDRPPLDPKIPQARLIETLPRDGDQAFYPVEVYDRGGGEGVGERRILRFAFDVAMDTSRTSVKLRAPERSLQGTWSGDGKTIEAVVLGDDDHPPLEPEREYEVDLGELRGAGREPVSKSRLRFRTAARDMLIEHACIHTLFGPFEPLRAASKGSAIASAPLAGSTHKQYTVTLTPDGGGFAGDLRVAFTGSGSRKYFLLLDSAPAVTLTDGAGAAVATTTAPTVEACPAIRQRVEVTLTRGATYRLALSSPGSSVKAIWETP